MAPDAVIIVAVAAIITALSGLVVAITALIRIVISDKEMMRTQKHIEHIDKKLADNGNGK